VIIIGAGLAGLHCARLLTKTLSASAAQVRGGNRCSNSHTLAVGCHIAHLRDVFKMGTNNKRVEDECCFVNLSYQL